MNKLLEWYRGRKIFITGDTGFKGSWLAYILSNTGSEVCGYALPPTESCRNFSLLGLAKKIRHIDGDIRNSERLFNSLNEFKPEVVFHLAAQPLVRLSYKQPAYTFETNIMGTVNMLDSARKIETIKSLILVTSDKCYQNNEWFWGYRENDQLGGHDPYSASKAAAEIVFSSFKDSFFSMTSKKGVASVRAGNVIGGGDWSEDRIVPDCIRAVRNGNPVILRNPNSTRPWQHVLEPLSGYMLLASKLYDDCNRYSGSWNFGPEMRSIRTVEELTKEIIANWGEGSYEVFKAENSFREAGLLHLNCDKAKQVLDWVPRWEFEPTIKKTVEWYKTYYDNENKIEDITEQQIAEYFNGDKCD